MAESKGTDSLDDWLLVEAECEDTDGLNDLEHLFECSTDGSDVSNLIDDHDEVDQGNSLALFNEQLLHATKQEVAELKRKYVSPSPKQGLIDLSPQLQSVSISPQRSSKRRLFQDSGIGHEVEDTPGPSQVDREDCVHAGKGTVTDTGTESGTENETNRVDGDGEEETDVLYGPRTNENRDVLDLLRSSNLKATQMAKIKDLFGVSYTELTRNFKSDKSCCNSWVIAVFAVLEGLLEAAKTLLQPHCEYFQLINPLMGPSTSILLLAEFKSSKNRECVLKLLMTMLNVSERQIIADPPKNRSVATALFFYKHSMTNTSYCFGEMPPWIGKQVLLNHQLSTETFELAQMVQWAYDYGYTDESEIAYKYALIGDEDANAAAWLKSNNQAKYVRDCARMVQLYKRQEMREMSMSEWIYKCCARVKDTGDWKVISQFLKYQNVNLLAFLTALRRSFAGIPKKTCIVIVGPPDTGKSYFCYSLVQFLGGKVVSYLNAKSHFWLQPLADCKFGFLDDATDSCWNYMDIYMRSALDGNSVSVDTKHKAPMQLKLPSMFITTNIDVGSEQMYSYLHSRLTCFKFPNKLPLNADGTPLYKFTDETWKSFFIKLEKQLGLCNTEEEGDGNTGRAFRCTAGETSGTV